MNIKLDGWFPNPLEPTIYGRFVDVEAVDTKASRAAVDGKEVFTTRIALQTKVISPATSPADPGVSSHPLKSYNEVEFKARFPGAWEHYLATKDGNTQDVAPRAKNNKKQTPLDEADFLPPEVVAAVKRHGLSSVEEIAKLPVGQQAVVLGPAANALMTMTVKFLEEPQPVAQSGS